MFLCCFSGILCVLLFYNYISIFVNQMYLSKCFINFALDSTLYSTFYSEIRHFLTICCFRDREGVETRGNDL